MKNLYKEGFAMTPKIARALSAMYEAEIYGTLEGMEVAESAGESTEFFSAYLSTLRKLKIDADSKI